MTKEPLGVYDAKALQNTERIWKLANKIRVHCVYKLLGEDTQHSAERTGVVLALDEDIAGLLKEFSRIEYQRGWDGASEHYNEILKRIE